VKTDGDGGDVVEEGYAGVDEREGRGVDSCREDTLGAEVSSTVCTMSGTVDCSLNTRLYG